MTNFKWDTFCCVAWCIRYYKKLIQYVTFNLFMFSSFLIVHISSCFFFLLLASSFFVLLTSTDPSSFYLFLPLCFISNRNYSITQHLRKLWTQHAKTTRPSLFCTVSIWQCLRYNESIDTSCCTIFTVGSVVSVVSFEHFSLPTFCLCSFYRRVCSPYFSRHWPSHRTKTVHLPIRW